MVRKYSKAKEIFLEQINASSCHGLSNIFRNDLIVLKLMWLIVWLCGMALLCFFTLIGFNDYFKYDVNTKTRHVYEPQIFPKVTICNQNQFTTNFSIDFLHDLIEKDSNYNDLSKDGNLYNFYYLKKL